MIRFLCSKCGKKLKADETIIGRKVKCSHCRHVEAVPPFDNLEKPKTTKRRSSAANGPKSKRRVEFPDRESASRRMDRDSASSFGQLKSAATLPSESSQPIFKAKPKRAGLKVWIPIGLVGVGVLASLLVWFNLNWILDAKRKLNTDYQNLPEVVLYRRAASDLEKSRRVMRIMGRAYIASKSAPQEVADELDALEEFNASVEALSKDPETIDEVERLFRAGKDTEAKAILVSGAKAMNKRQIEVERKTQAYNDKSY